jgi:hypothetical protein
MLCVGLVGFYFLLFDFALFRFVLVSLDNKMIFAVVDPDRAKLNVTEFAAVRMRHRKFAQNPTPIQILIILSSINLHP